MEEKDFIKREVDVLARALLSLIGKVLNTSDNSEVNIKMDIDNDYSENLGISIRETVELSDNELIDFLSKNNNQEFAWVEQLAVFLYHYLPFMDEKESSLGKDKIMLIHKFLGKNRPFVSFDLARIISELKSN